MNQIEALARLQKLESSIDAAKLRLEEIKIALNKNEPLEDALALKDECQIEKDNIHSTVTNLEMEIEGLVTKMGESQQILYGGEETNPKQLQARQAEIESLQNRQTALEADLQYARQLLDLAELEMSEATELVTVAELAAQARNKALRDEHDLLSKQTRENLSNRKSVLSDIDARTHKIYKRVKKVKNGVAVGFLEGDTCSACLVTQTQMIIHQVKQRDNLVYCHACGRILIEDR